MKYVVPMFVLVLGLSIGASLSYAKPEYAKKEKKSCVTCHVANGKKELNDVGKCYGEKKHSLEGCEVKK